ncbi:MAG: PQQ-binding-like beta-propeller repeat protein [Alphaproteobacteria bacterium]|nr:PQQ-binding-like beta-propeller repeat protein [Alphaproteobacteria bacterium]
MRKIAILTGICLVVAACDSHDPILPGVRSDIFTSNDLNILNTSVPNVSDNAVIENDAECPYTQKPDNTIWDDTRKIFSGFATNNYVAGDKKPVCNGNFVYAGLSTGELVKVNGKTRQMAWIADVYRASNMMGGASVVDIIAAPKIYKNYVYVGGLGDAFCKISDATGRAAWCIDIGVEKNFILTDAAIYVLDTDNNLNAIRMQDGAIYWRTAIKKSRTPKYKDKIIKVGSEKIDAETGKILE